MTLRFSFGTAGIRALMGDGEDHLNNSTVRAIAYAMVRQLETFGDDARQRGIVVGFDGRAHSRDFAVEICRVAIAAGFMVQLYAREVPTPLLAFATRQLNAVGGIMVTASHNPPSDNGIKLFLAGGAQVVPPHDREISQRIACASNVSEIPRVELELALQAERLRMLDPGDNAAYLEAIGKLVPSRRDLPLPRIAYSATSGVGTQTSRALFARLGANDVSEVKEHALPAHDFGGLSSPNPEEPEALQRLISLVEREQIDTGFAHDPDADRLAVLARDRQGALRILSGDQVGALLGDFLLSHHKHKERALLVSTHVSGGLLESLVKTQGAHYLRAPTGFKWIASLGRAHADAHGLDLLFGYEEAIGYAFFDMAQDKDGIAAMYVLCELLRRLRVDGKSLHDRLDELSVAHGLFASRPFSVHTIANDGSNRTESIMAKLRNTDVKQLLGSDGDLQDYEAAATPLPLVVLHSQDGLRVCVRPSGTEPKLKFYLHAREPVASVDEVAVARARCEDRLFQLERRLRVMLAV